MYTATPRGHIRTCQAIRSARCCDGLVARLSVVVSRALLQWFYPHSPPYLHTRFRNLNSSPNQSHSHLTSTLLSDPPASSCLGGSLTPPFPTQVLQVIMLMWLRTAINYQCVHTLCDPVLRLFPEVDCWCTYPPKSLI
jgi:hypothetical protein